MRLLEGRERIALPSSCHSRHYRDNLVFCLDSKTPLNNISFCLTLGFFPERKNE